MTKEEAYKKLSSFCSSGEHCRSELNEKMKRWVMDRHDIDHVITRLEEEDFLNEERFCRAFINDKLRFDKWGRIKIGQALQVKKIPTEKYRSLLSNIDEEAYTDMLKGLLKSKCRSLHTQDAIEMKAKLIRFAQSRGFEMRFINACIELLELPNMEKSEDD